MLSFGEVTVFVFEIVASTKPIVAVSVSDLLYCKASTTTESAADDTIRKLVLSESCHDRGMPVIKLLILNMANESLGLNSPEMAIELLAATKRLRTSIGKEEGKPSAEAIAGVIGMDVFAVRTPASGALLLITVTEVFVRLSKLIFGFDIDHVIGKFNGFFNGILADILNAAFEILK